MSTERDKDQTAALHHICSTISTCSSTCKLLLFSYLLILLLFLYLRVESDRKELPAEVAKLSEARCETRKYNTRRADADIGAPC